MTEPDYKSLNENARREVERLKKDNIRLAASLEKMRAALRFFENGENWRLNGPLDPNSGNFIGTIHALAALSESEKGEDNG